MSRTSHRKSILCFLLVMTGNALVIGCAGFVLRSTPVDGFGKFQAAMISLALGMLGLSWKLFLRIVAGSQNKIDLLHESEWFARSTVDALSAQIAVLDSSGCILAVNRAWRESAGPNDSIIARADEGANYLAICDGLVGKNCDGAAAIASGIRSVATGQCGDAYAEYHGTVHGERRWYLCRITRFPGNVKVRIVMAHEDITGRKHAEESATEAKRIADAANQSKSAFLANMSHEIRTPMTAMLGYADLLLDPKQSAEERSRCVQVIRRNGEHLLGLINDVLDISKIEANKYDIEPVSTDLRQLLGDVVSLTRVKAIQKGLNFKVIIDGPVPKEIRTDPLRLKQILVNLVGNAVKFTAHGSVYLRVSCQDRVVNSTLHVDVLDTGIGMSAEQIDRLFRPFTQVDESTTRKFGGTGLGLVISRKFAQLLGGDIGVQSEQGVGTCFSLWVDTGPLGGVRMLPSLDEADLITAPTTAISRCERFSGKVLLAEDGEDNQALISLLLRNAGAEVLIAPNGLIAHNIASSTQFDLILMDMQMPELDGYSATRKLRDGGYTKPIVALTANAMPHDRAKCLAAGCDDYLTKPIVLDQLHNMLGRYLQAVEPAPLPATTTPQPAQSGDPSNKLRSGLAGNDKFKNVLERFVARLPERIDEMHRLLQANNLDQLARSVHQMKGAAGGYGFPDITLVASQAEESIKQAADLELITKQMQELVEMIRRIEGYPQNEAPLPVMVTSVPAPAPPAEQPRTRVDLVTGLPNRNHLVERLSSEIAFARRQHKTLACVAIEIDQIKELAENFPPDVIDSLAKRVSAVMQIRTREEIGLFRIDTGRFVALGPDCNYNQAMALAEDLAKLIQGERFGDLIGNWKLTCVFGLACLKLTTISAADLLSATLQSLQETRKEPAAAATTSSVAVQA